MFTRALIDVWDPELKLRDGDERISVLQVITILFDILVGIITFMLDIITLPWQIRHIYRDDD